MASNALRLAALAGLLMAGAAFAQDASAPADVPTAPMASSTQAINVGVGTLGDLDRIQSEIIVAQARLQLVQTQQSLAQAQGTSPMMGSGASTLVPVVAGVFGTEAQPYAKFLLGDGAEAIGRTGDVLPGDFRVVHVGVDKVVIKDKKGKQIVARFSSTAPSQPQPSSVAAPQAGPLAPGAPPVTTTTTSGG